MVNASYANADNPKRMTGNQKGRVLVMRCSFLERRANAVEKGFNCEKNPPRWQKTTHDVGAALINCGMKMGLTEGPGRNVIPE
jgi:hypothetical protein